MRQRKSATELAKIFNRIDPEPARHFEEAYGLSGIAEKYDFPEGLSARKIEKDGYWKKDHPTLSQLWAQLVDRNPRLNAVTLREDSRLDLSHAVQGVASGFNVNDINFFLELDRKGVPAGAYLDKNAETREIYDWIRKETGRDDIRWVPSPPTFREIKRQLLL